MAFSLFLLIGHLLGIYWECPLAATRSSSRAFSLLDATGMVNEVLGHYNEQW